MPTDTPLAQASGGNPELVLKMIAVTRLVTGNTNIPATTALATLNRHDGRELGLVRGANVVMPNLTPPQYRKLYEIYPDKACVAESGEVMVKSAGLLKEYYKNPAATAEVLDADGWYHTGDAGFLDAGGHLKIIDRAKDVGRIMGGANDGAMFAPKYVENKLKFFPFIKEAVAFGDKREKVCAFVNIDFEAVGNWAEKRNLPYAGYTDLAAKPEVLELVRECVEKVNADLSADTMLAGSQISRFLVLHKELDADDGELTRTRKVRRGYIGEKYQVLVDALYGGSKEQFIETAVKFEDGRSGSVSATVKIIDAKTYPAMKKAA